MTRINIVPVEELYDQHLIAEYREFPMVPAALKRTLKSKKGLQYDKISKFYTLNSGHVYFFYNKGEFLNKRYQQIIEEMKKRGFEPDPNRKFPIEDFPKELRNDWSPEDFEINISRERIALRISQKPNWYRKTLYKEEK